MMVLEQAYLTLIEKDSVQVQHTGTLVNQAWKIEEEYDDRVRRYET